MESAQKSAEHSRDQKMSWKKRKKEQSTWDKVIKDSRTMMKMAL